MLVCELMKRRTILRSLAGAPVLTAPGVALAQTPTGSNAPTADDQVKIEVSGPDAIADPQIRFFTPQQYATLVRLSELIAPATPGRASAREAETPQFLDFLISRSPGNRQVLYTDGLDGLDIAGRARHGKAFAELDESAATELLSPLRDAWTWAPSPDPMVRFLREAKMDILRATANSRASATAGGSRRASGVNTYWEPVE